MPNTSKVILRPVVLSDANDLLKWENNELNWSVSDTTSPYILSDIILLIEKLEDIEEAKQARYIILEASTRRAIGAVDLFDIDFSLETASVGILIAKNEDRRQGFAKESLVHLEQIARDELGLEKLIAKVHQENTSSVKLFESSGFSKKKLTRDGQLNNGDYIQTLIFEKCLKK